MGFRNQGRGRSGQGSGRFGGRGFNRKSNKDNKEKKKDDNKYQFAPYQDSKTNVKTYTSVKEHMLGQIKKTFKYGNNIAEFLEGTDEPFGHEPQRTIVYYTLKKDKEGKPTGEPEDPWRARVEQEGADIKYSEDLKAYRERSIVFDQNKYKAYEYILGHCSKVMKARIEEQADYEARVKNQPRVLLEEISKKMYDAARAKYKYMSLT